MNSKCCITLFTPTPHATLFLHLFLHHVSSLFWSLLLTALPLNHTPGRPLNIILFLSVLLNIKGQRIMVVWNKYNNVKFILILSRHFLFSPHSTTNHLSPDVNFASSYGVSLDSIKVGLFCRWTNWIASKSWIPASAALSPFSFSRAMISCRWHDLRGEKMRGK